MRWNARELVGPVGALALVGLYLVDRDGGLAAAVVGGLVVFGVLLYVVGRILTRRFARGDGWMLGILAAPWLVVVLLDLARR
jgi:hypothetical protein